MRQKEHLGTITTAPAVHRLVVAGPTGDRLYSRFSRLYAGRGDVVVIRDRRRGDRRCAAMACARERRHSGDRRELGATWVFPPAA